MSKITWEDQYLDLVSSIVQEGDDRMDRTGTGTRALFGRTLDINLTQGFPAVTTKKLAWKAVVSELLWFLEGSTDERRLAEILHGTRDPSKRTIWTDNAEAAYWVPKAKFPGDLGPVYGSQWRSWNVSKVKSYEDFVNHHNELREGTTYFGAKTSSTNIDQIAEVIQKLKSDPTDRRMIVSAWNPGEIQDMALPPCHMFMQFFVSSGKKLSCSMYQRSVDTMLGLPFNIASYALLTHLIAQVTGHVPDRLIMNLGDTHIYADHLDAALTQLTRTPRHVPMLSLNKNIMDIDMFTMKDIALVEYDPAESLPMKMST